ncbi:patatin-like phospholipase family protein [Flavobacterium lacisediminis]|uniref:Patatin-like phospholipase family protein n=1 Tax=Flavobacterium lacisediminis TaxID=2989705 RepID=A0ABT3EF35_9FLAO|nr:patatin-like phospholipase family protein [Flavobacterium lacisediminis]MCW1147031.1 patatin-like phospholipase family protein [Flavobacterium lacisediminis]
MKKLLLFVSLLIFTQISLGQENQRPKVGLVLSGGGAKGLAHIGVLKVIDSLGIKVDYIAGTSMGAIVGGLYASGYNAEQLDSIFSKIDVDALLQDYTPRESKSFYEKRNDEIYALTLPFNKFKLGLPSGLSKGLYNFNLISSLTQQVSHIRDFDELPIPFLCIATDAETGEKIVLDSGVLAQNMIASGALPTLYSPVEMNGRLLIDGGVIDNYPVEELKARGLDIIIGVDVQDGLKTREELKEVTSVLAQINNFSMIEKMEGKQKATDIYIKPDIKGYTVVDFEKGNEIIAKGKEKALEFIKELAPYGNSNSKNDKKIVFQDSIYIKDIVFNKLDNYTRAYIVGKLKFKRNTKISNAQLQKGILNLNATQNFSAINYSFEKMQDGDKLILQLKENDNNTFLKFGLHYDDLFKSGILLNYTKKRLIAKNDVASLDVILGDNIRYNFDYYIDNGFHWSFGFNSKLTTFNRNITSNIADDAIFNTTASAINVDFFDLSNQAYLQTIFAQKFSLGGGLEFKFLRLESETLENTDPVFDSSDYLSVFGFVKYDSFDKKYFPRTGWNFNSEIRSYVYSSDYKNNFERFSVAKADFGVAQTVFKNMTLKFQTEGGFAVGERSVSYFDFILGGYGFQQVNNIKPFFGYDFLSIAGDSYVKLLLTADYEIFKKHHLNFIANFANVGDKIFDTLDTWLVKPNYSGYSVGYGMETVIGPVEIKHSWSPETRDHYTWFSVGFWF